jgi:hypothetical protein
LVIVFHLITVSLGLLIVRVLKHVHAQTHAQLTVLLLQIRLRQPTLAQLQTLDKILARAQPQLVQIKEMVHVAQLLSVIVMDGITQPVEVGQLERV